MSAPPGRASQEIAQDCSRARKSSFRAACFLSASVINTVDFTDSANVLTGARQAPQ